MCIMKFINKTKLDSMSFIGGKKKRILRDTALSSSFLVPWVLPFSIVCILKLRTAYELSLHLLAKLSYTHFLYESMQSLQFIMTRS